MIGPSVGVPRRIGDFGIKTGVMKDGSVVDPWMRIAAAVKALRRVHAAGG